jgi:hypothetical protein
MATKEASSKKTSVPKPAGVSHRKQKPKKYDPSICEAAIAMGKTGSCREQIAIDLGMSLNEIRGFEKLYPDFKAAMRAAAIEAHATITSRKKNPVGRPTKYFPEHCQLVIDLGLGGASKAQTARELHVCIDTLYEWAKVHAEFSEALTYAHDMAMAWWEDKAQAGIDVQGFNGGLWGRVMSARFPDHYRETNATELTGKGGTPLHQPLSPAEVDEAVAHAIQKFNEQF